MMALPPLWSVALLAALASAASGYWAGDRNRNNAWLAQQAAQVAIERDVLQAAQVRGDLLSAGLLTQAGQIVQLKQESIDAIKQATSGRVCLDAAALRVLDAAPGIAVMPDAASSAAAADGRFASDTDVGTWAAEAGALFETCRARLDALIDWHAR